MAAVNNQVGGDHYKGMGYQPFTLAMDLAGTPGLCKVAKYLTRKKDDRLQNLKKAYHVIELEHEWVDNFFGIGGWDELHELTPGQKALIDKFCNQFEHHDVYRTILTCMILGKYSKAKENLTKFVKYRRWEIV